jgi:hypothetical protein
VLSSSRVQKLIYYRQGASFGFSMGSPNQAYATYGGAVYLSFGLLSVAMSSLLGNATTLSTSQFLTLWGEASVMLVLGLLLMITGPMAGSGSDLRRVVGGAVGAISALIGALLAPAIINYTTGIMSQVGVGSRFLSDTGLGQLSVAFWMVLITAFVVMLVGFPLGMVGSFQVLQDNERSSPEQQ